MTTHDNIHDREQLVPRILDYLDRCLPGYPFNPNVDRPFVEELLDDFPGIDILEEVKTFRWYYENQPLTRIRSPRVALRRWIANARPS
jgi:hypothetical protein